MILVVILITTSILVFKHETVNCHEHASEQITTATISLTKPSMNDNFHDSNNDSHNANDNDTHNGNIDDKQ